MAKIASVVVALAVPFVVLAFWPMYLSRRFAEIDRFTHLHAVTGSLWLALLVAQSATVAARRFALHRGFGWVSYGLAGLFAVSGVLLSHHRLAAMSDATFVIEGYAHYLPFYATVVFVVAYVLGLRFRRMPSAHGRFMLCTAIPLIDPVLGRVIAFYLPPLPNPWLYQVVTFTIATAAAGLLVFSFRGPAPARRALLGFFVLLVSLEFGWFFVSTTPEWLEAARWFRALPLT